MIVSGFKPDPDVSGFEAAKKFLHDVLEKTDDEIQHIGLTSAEFNGVSTDWPTGVLCFKAESTVISLLKLKGKARNKNIKIKNDVPIAYR